MAELTRQALLGNGEVIGERNQTPEQVVSKEHNGTWKVVRKIYHGTNSPGVPVLARAHDDTLWVVVNDHGPYGAIVGEWLEA